MWELSSANVEKVVNAPRNPMNRTGRYGSTERKRFLNRTNRNPARNDPSRFTVRVAKGNDPERPASRRVPVKRQSVPSAQARSTRKRSFSENGIFYSASR